MIFRWLLAAALALGGPVAPAWAGAVRASSSASAAPRAVMPTLPFAAALGEGPALPALEAVSPASLALPSLAPEGSTPAPPLERAAEARALVLAAPAAAGAAAALPFARPNPSSADPAGRPNGAAARAIPTAREQAVALAPRDGDAPSGSGRAGALAGWVFDGWRRAEDREAGPVAVSAGYAEPAALGKADGAPGEDAAPGADVPPPAEPAAGLPWAYRFYLAGLVLSSIGQAISTVLLPNLAYFAQGPGFAVLSQAIGLGTIIPGSYVGVWWVKRFGSKSAYLWANALTALVFVSLPLSIWLTGAILPAHYLLFSAAGGIMYGMLRGVAEQDIAVRILGQGSEPLLRKAASMYYLFVAPVYIATSMATGLLMTTLGKDFFNVFGALTMLASALPFLMIRAAGPGLAEAGPAVGERKAWTAYAPYVFFWGVHLAFYYTFAPFFALEVFHNEPLGAWLTGLYSLGNFLAATTIAYLPGLGGKLGARGWSLLGVAGIAAFLWASLGLASPALSMALVVWMGAGVTAGMIQWKAAYQKSVPADAQPGLFRSLTNAGVAANLVPFALLYGAAALWPGVSMPFLLALIGGATTLLGLWLAASLLRRR